MKHDLIFPVKSYMEQIKSHILKLSEVEKNELLKWFISQMVDHPVEWDQLLETLKRVQEWDEGKITPLSHEEFWASVDQHLDGYTHRKGA